MAARLLPSSLALLVSTVALIVSMLSLSACRPPAGAERYAGSALGRSRAQAAAVV